MPAARKREFHTKCQEEVYRLVKSCLDELVDEHFDVACSRATLEPRAWLEEGSRLARSVWVLLARGSAPALDGHAIVECHDYAWPLTRAPRRALKYAPA